MLGTHRSYRITRVINKGILLGAAGRVAKFRNASSGKHVVGIRLASILVANGEEESRFHWVTRGARVAEATVAYVEGRRSTMSSG